MGENFFGKSAKTTDEWHNTETKSLKTEKIIICFKHPDYQSSIQMNFIHFYMSFLFYIYDNVTSLYPYLK